jgi:hypothetical protein
MIANQEWVKHTTLDIHDGVILGGTSIFDWLVVAPLPTEQADITSSYEVIDIGKTLSLCTNSAAC